MAAPAPSWRGGGEGGGVGERGLPSLLSLSLPLPPPTTHVQEAGAVVGAQGGEDVADDETDGWRRKRGKEERGGWVGGGML